MRGLVPLVAVALVAGTSAAAAQAAGAAPGVRPAAGADPGCLLSRPDNAVKHVIYLQFDNVHLTRDNPNVPSDLEQMPNLLNFLTANGTMDANHHTPLIAHTGNDILTSITGLYGSNHGQPISNSFRYYTPSGTTNAAASFAYWTDGVADSSTPTPTDPAYEMVTQSGKNTPAPWVAYTRAGCDFGAVSTANTILENTRIDIPKVFGANSAEAAELAANPSLAFTDFVGIGVHCAKDSTLCAGSPNAKPDVLPDEPGGYSGYQGLFGAKYTNPAISPNGPVTQVDGTTPIIDPTTGANGFPGFDGMTAANSLGYVAQMQEAGVPVTYGYISDAHDNHSTGSAYGPGEAGYVAALKSYDTAFGQFFTRLAKDGINKSNTLFVVTSDENDHFVGSKPTPANCDGVTVPCAYSQIGEVNANIKGLLATQQNTTTPFGVHADSAPNYYVNGNPAPDDPTTRSFERSVAAVTATNPYTGKTGPIANYLADRTEMNLLHMVTGDPLRTPTVTEFADPDYYLYGGAANCNSPCVQAEAAYAWNHGDFSPDINTTWLGLVGPGVKHLGVTDAVWSDHTDIRPTMMALLGLHDDYTYDGVPLIGFLKSQALPHEVRRDPGAYEALAAAYKQLDASVGAFAAATLKTATTAIESNSPGDATYLQTDAALAALGQQRDALAAELNQLINGPFFGGADSGYLHAELAPHGIQGTGHNSVTALTSAAEALINKA
ncbi:hypothetical protein KGA66_08385 [Actinocrinis puniceicyclus]|uniref:Uncharacterized protein n=1 Tax=Actinocrinis puniceicyclus TaxID=977794 RepID=A0A8J7WIT7_9ACTN|nr:hypothetical protein [Actinocrinis puniceicyclus]MBS2963058.1 hypothetical protein [Actinocrinis puniceicyclus]